MNTKKIVVGLCLFGMTVQLQANWFERTKQQLKLSDRELIIAGTSAGIISIGSYLFHRLSNSYTVHTAKKSIEKQEVFYKTMLIKHDHYRSLDLNNLALISQEIPNVLFLISQLNSDLAAIKETCNELEKIKIQHKENDKIDGTITTLLDKFYQLVSQLQELTTCIYTHRGYFSLERTYADIAPNFKAELASQSPTLNKHQIISLAQSNLLSMAKAYPLCHYGSQLSQKMSQLTFAISEFEKTEGKGSSVPFYAAALELEQKLNTIKNALVALPEYASQLIQYGEAQRQEAIVTAERRKAFAAEEQANAEKKKVSIAKKQLEQDRKNHILKEQLLKQREKITSKLDDINYNVRNLPRYHNQTLVLAVSEIQRQLAAIEGSIQANN